MKYEIIHDDSKGLLVVHTEGAIELEVENEMILDVIAHPMWSRKFNVLFDHSHSSLDHLKTIDIQKLSNVIKHNSAKLGKIKIAIVLSSDLSFGLGRMWSTLR